MVCKLLLLTASGILLGGMTSSRGQANTSLSNLANLTSINRSLTPGVDGVYSLGSNTRSWRNLYITGSVFLHNQISLSGHSSRNNFYVGFNAGSLATTGTRNVGLGSYSLSTATTGFANAAGGYYSLRSTTTGYENAAFGGESGRFNTSGYQNTFIGFRSGYNNTAGRGNTFVGYNAGFRNVSSQYNAAFGFQALYSSININYNSAFGAFAAYSTSGGGYNAAFGYQAMRSNVTGGMNAVFGSNALYSNTGGSQNAAFGYQAGMISKGSYNAYFGAYAGNTVKGSNNTFIGYHAAGFVDSVTNSTALGYYTITTASNQVRVGNLSVTSIGGFQAWSNLSDGRFKKDVQENVPGLVFINKLRPVTYVVKTNELRNYFRSRVKSPPDHVERNTAPGDDRVKTGFVAQEVEAVAKEIGFIFDGVDAPENKDDLYALRYAEFVVPLVKAVQELSRLNDEKDSIIAEIQQNLNDLMCKDGLLTPNGSKAFLRQNYPNPARHSTIVEYTIPENAGSARISLTDANGKMIRYFNLPNSAKGNITINIGTLAQGVYHYSLIIDGKTAGTRQLTVVR